MFSDADNLLLAVVQPWLLAFVILPKTVSLLMDADKSWFPLMWEVVYNLITISTFASHYGTQDQVTESETWSSLHYRMMFPVLPYTTLMIVINYLFDRWFATGRIHKTQKAGTSTCISGKCLWFISCLMGSLMWCDRPIVTDGKKDKNCPYRIEILTGLTKCPSVEYVEMSATLTVQNLISCYHRTYRIDYLF